MVRSLMLCTVAGLVVRVTWARVLVVKIRVVENIEVDGRVMNRFEYFTEGRIYEEW